MSSKKPTQEQLRTLDAMLRAELPKQRNAALSAPLSTKQASRLAIARALAMQHHASHAHQAPTPGPLIWLQPWRYLLISLACVFSAWVATSYTAPTPEHNSVLPLLLSFSEHGEASVLPLASPLEQLSFYQK